MTDFDKVKPGRRYIWDEKSVYKSHAGHTLHVIFKGELRKSPGRRTFETSIVANCETCNRAVKLTPTYFPILEIVK